MPLSNNSIQKWWSVLYFLTPFFKKKKKKKPLSLYRFLSTWLVEEIHVVCDLNHMQFVDTFFKVIQYKIWF